MRDPLALPHELLAFAFFGVRDAASGQNSLRLAGLFSDRAQRRSDRLRHTDQECLVLGAAFIFACFHLSAPFQKSMRAWQRVIAVAFPNPETLTRPLRWRCVDPSAGISRACGHGELLSGDLTSS
jgi:hypothetical protein